MASTPKFYDRVMAASTTTGTGTYTLGSTITGFQAWSALGDGNSAFYCAQEVDGNGNPSGGWEVGLGSYTTAGTTLSRDTVLASSNAGAAVNWSAGTRRIFLTMPAAVSVPQTNPAMGTLLLGAKYIRVFGSNLATGDTDLYTVPTGKRLLVTSTSAYQASGSTIPWFLQIKISGTYYRLIQTQSTTTGSALHTGLTGSMFEAGDVVAINTATAAGLNIACAAIEFDAASPLKQGRVAGPATGDNTLYTCPTGKSAVIVNAQTGTPFSFLASGPGTVAFTTDGSTRNVYYHLVASGGSVATTNRVTELRSPGASVRQFTNLSGSLGAGDFLNINVDVGNAAQLATVYVVEF